MRNRPLGDRKNVLTRWNRVTIEFSLSRSLRLFNVISTQCRKPETDECTRNKFTRKWLQAFSCKKMVRRSIDIFSSRHFVLFVYRSIVLLSSKTSRMWSRNDIYKFSLNCWFFLSSFLFSFFFFFISCKVIELSYELSNVLYDNSLT